MKVKAFLVSGMLAAGAVLLYQKRDDILAEVAETTETYTNAQKSLASIKQNLGIIQAEQEKLQQIKQDLSYKFRVFNKELQAHLAEIQIIADKYKQAE